MKSSTVWIEKSNGAIHATIAKKTASRHVLSLVHGICAQGTSGYAMKSYIGKKSINLSIQQKNEGQKVI
jgi:hypothetical protein